MSTNIVAVYGSLREGLSDHTLLADCKRIAIGWLTGFKMYNLGELPGVISTNDDSGRIRIEWYFVSDETLDKLDAHKQYDADNLKSSVHTRRRLFSPYGAGWIYVYNNNLDSAPYMEAGDWTRYTKDLNSSVA